jgi:endoglucanase
MYWFGGNLTGVGHSAFPHRFTPAHIALDIPNRLVYSVHDYGPAMARRQPWTQLGSTAETPEACITVWDKTWGFILNQNIAPILIGEFGTPNGRNPNHPEPPETYTDVNRTNPQGNWFSYLVEYIRDRNIHWTYWCLNGTQSQAPGRSPNRPEGYGILDPTWSAVASEPMMRKLQSAQ